MDQKDVNRPWLPFVIESFYCWIVARSALLISLVAGATFLAMLLLRLHLVSAYAPELGGIESNVIYTLQRILDGYPLYVDPAAPPYAITQYTPLYYYLCWGVGRLAGVDAANVHHVYVLSRGRVFAPQFTVCIVGVRNFAEYFPSKAIVELASAGLRVCLLR